MVQAAPLRAFKQRVFDVVNAAAVRDIFITNICMLEGDALVVKSNYIDVVSFPKTGVEQFLTTGVKASLLFRIRISSVSLRRRA